MTADATHPLPVWTAQLEVHVGGARGAERLLHNRHQGPLRVQKLLTPGGGQAAELLLVHPPGGIAGGDDLQLRLRIGSAAACLCTTPGATRWYRSAGAPARQHVRLQVDADACCEWLPQDTIVQDGALAEQQLDVRLAANAAWIGMELVQLGQPASARPWRSGYWRTALTIWRVGRLLLVERGELRPDDLADGAAAQRMGRHSVLGALWVCPQPGSVADEALQAECRALLAQDPHVLGSLSWLDDVGVLVIRALGSDAQSVRARLHAVWAQLRPWALALDAVRPRIWAT